MNLSLERITDTLPMSFAELEADAQADGHDHLTWLAAEFAMSPAILHAIFACHLAGRLAGIGAIYRRTWPYIAADITYAAALGAPQI